jgi:cytosine/uracil/thiamine/allantoin permease
MTGLNVIIGLFSSLAVNMPDFGRFSKNRLKGPHQFLALPIIGTLGALTPIFVTDAHSYLWGEFEWSVYFLLYSTVRSTPRLPPESQF